MLSPLLPQKSCRILTWIIATQAAPTETIQRAVGIRFWVLGGTFLALPMTKMKLRKGCTRLLTETVDKGVDEVRIRDSFYGLCSANR